MEGAKPGKKVKEKKNPNFTGVRVNMEKPRDTACKVRRLKDSSTALRKGLKCIKQRENLYTFLFKSIVKVKGKLCCSVFAVCIVALSNLDTLILSLNLNPEVFYLPKILQTHIMQTII